MKVLFATANPGKVAEARRVMGHLGLDFHSLSDLSLSGDVEESAGTLEGNALLKARAAAEQAPGYIVVADDTGLEIDALDGEPGVYVRRWRDRAREMTDDEIVDHCMERMKDVPEGDRGAQMRSVICILVSGREPVYCDGVLRGRILQTPEPVDPNDPGMPIARVLWVDEWNMSLGDQHRLPASKSVDLPTHRGRALRAAAAHLSQIIG